MGVRIYESMTKIPVVTHEPALRRGWNPKLTGVIRVWRKERSLEAACSATNEDIFALVEKLGADATPQQIIEAIEKLDRIEAIEFTNECGCGPLLYPNWE